MSDITEKFETNIGIQQFKIGWSGAAKLFRSGSNFFIYAACNYFICAECKYIRITKLSPIPTKK